MNRLLNGRADYRSPRLYIHISVRAGADLSMCPVEAGTARQETGRAGGA
jgi:hypothetical protein